MSRHAFGAGRNRPHRRVAAIVVVLVGVTGAGCSGGGDDGAGGAESESSTTATTLPFEENDAAVRLNIAATGMNLVASDVGLRTLRGPAVDYCRSQAPAELEPHRSELGAAVDPTVRQHAEAALAELAKAIELCANDAGSPAIQAALEKYNASFERLRERIDARRGAGG